MQAKPANITYDPSQFGPVIQMVNFHNHLTIHKGHIDNFNEGKGDIPFEKAGAYLHKLYFENIKPVPRNTGSNQIYGKAAEILELRYGTMDNFIKTYMDTVNKLQGSGWVFMNTSGYLNIIPNNRIVDKIGFIIDFWEHAYYPDYGPNREGYARDAIKLIDWNVVNKRILESKDKKPKQEPII